MWSICFITYKYCSYFIDSEAACTWLFKVFWIHQYSQYTVKYSFWTTKHTFLNFCTKKLICTGKSELTQIASSLAILSVFSLPDMLGLPTGICLSLVVSIDFIFWCFVPILRSLSFPQLLISFTHGWTSLWAVSSIGLPFRLSLTTFVVLLWQRNLPKSVVYSFHECFVLHVQRLSLQLFF